MLEFFRHHRGAFLIVLTVIIIISFSVWGGYTRSGGGASGTDKAFTIYGRNYTVAEAQRMQRMFELTRILGMFQFGIELLTASRNFETRDSSPLDFTLNLIVLQKKMEEFGIHPSDAEAVEALQSLPAFQKEGKFDEGQAALVEENLGAYGFRSADLLELIKYEIGFRKLKNLVTRNYVGSGFAAEKRYASMYQTIKGATIAFNLEDFKKQAEVSDEEIQKAYEEKKDLYKTPEKRALRWVFFPAPEDLDKIEDVAERNKKQADYIETVRSFADKTHQSGAKLEELAQQAGLKVEQASAFERDTPPEALQTVPGLIDELFALSADERPITDPVKGEKGYYIGELVSVEEPRQQELAEVKDRIRDSLVEQKAREAMATAVNDAREALGTGLKEGKKLEDLAKEKGLTLTPLPDFDPNTPPPGLANAYDIAREAENLAPGAVSKPVPVDTGVLLVIVQDKELRKREEGAAMRESVEASLTSSERESIFRAWFGSQKDAAGVKLLLSLG